MVKSDVIVVGAGPIGLVLARALADAGFSAIVLERQPRAALQAPAEDGREVALTHRSRALLERFGVWPRLPAAEISPIREARVINGRLPRFLQFDPADAGKSELGFLVAHDRIRRAAFEALAAAPAARLLDGVEVRQLQVGADAAGVVLADGRRLQAKVIVAADGRRSQTRERLGIGASIHEFGHAAIACRFAHEAPSDGIAYECFNYGSTLAMLPLKRRRVSAVLTVQDDEADTLMRMPAADYAMLVREQFGARLGRLESIGERHRFPLVAVYAHRFAAPRAALAGDAAVGMHPVTAHGFNLGLYGIDGLLCALRAARAAGNDIGAAASLAPYESEHRRATLPLYLGTNALVALFTNDRRPARAVRGAVIRLADRLPPLKHAITRSLTGVPRRS